jgi:hypothetical protein
LNSDVHELPAHSPSRFFNPNDGQYHTLTQPAVPLVGSKPPARARCRRMAGE